MRRLTEDQQREMADKARNFVPRRPGLGDAYLALVDALVRVLTLNRARIARTNRRGPIIR